MEWLSRKVRENSRPSQAISSSPPTSMASSSSGTWAPAARASWSGMYSQAQCWTCKAAVRQYTPQSCATNNTAMTTSYGKSTSTKTPRTHTTYKTWRQATYWKYKVALMQKVWRWCRIKCMGIWTSFGWLTLCEFYICFWIYYHHWCNFVIGIVGIIMEDGG